MSRGIFYLLVEESAREMQARMLVAVHAARLGFEVVIGPQWALIEQARRLPAGVMLFKGNNTVQVDNMARARAAGHAVASIEEEVLGLIDEGRIIDTYDPRVGRYCDLALAQGPFQRACLERRYPDLAGKVAVTGNPRLDLLRPPLNASVMKSAARIRERRGAFILVNSNYSSINPNQGDVLTGFRGWIQTRFLDQNNPADIEYFFSYCGWERANLRALLGFLDQATAGPLAGRVVLRPHPAENIRRWRDGFGADTRVKIVQDSDHLSWIAASAALVHTSCTTGLEAALLGTPSLNIITGDWPWTQHYATMIASRLFTDTREAVEAATNFLEAVDDASRGRRGSPSPRLDPPPGLDAHFLIDAISAAERVADALAALHGKIVSRAAGPLDVADRPLADWQARKFSTTVDDARGMLGEFVTALGIRETLTVEALAGGSLLVRGGA